MPGKSGTEAFAKHDHYETTGFLWAFFKYVIFALLDIFLSALKGAEP